MRVVIDTNVFIDAFFDLDKDCNLILKRESSEEYSLIMSHDMNEELQRILESSIKGLELTENEMITIYRKLSRALLRTEYIIPITRFSKCEDEDDNMFFECAIDGNADFIVSRDKHIQALRDTGIKNKNKKPIEILYPDEFIAKLDIAKLIIHFNSK